MLSDVISYSGTTHLVPSSAATAPATPVLPHYATVCEVPPKPGDTCWPTASRGIGRHHTRSQLPRVVQSARKTCSPILRRTTRQGPAQRQYLRAREGRPPHQPGGATRSG